MCERVLYASDLPTGSRLEHDGAERYLETLFESLGENQSSQSLLPSIAEIADRIEVSKESLWNTLNRLKRERQWDIDFQSGFYGSIMFTPTPAA